MKDKEYAAAKAEYEEMQQRYQRPEDEIRVGFFRAYGSGCGKYEDRWIRKSEEAFYRRKYPNTFRVLQE